MISTRRFTACAGVIAAGLLAPAPAAAQTHISNSAYGSIGTWADGPDRGAFAQTFTVPTNGDDVLQQFTFYLYNTDVNFRAYVFSWSNGMPTGAPLYTSDVFSGVNGPTRVTPVVVSTGGLPLSPGTVYGALLSAAGVSNTDATPHAFWEGGTAYTGGDFYFNYAPDPSGFTTTSWYKFDFGTESHFDFEFASASASTTPEMPETALLTTGLIPLAAAIRRRRTPQ